MIRKHIRKHKRIYLPFLLVILIIAIGWLIFELTIDDVKGRENPIKKILYQVTSILPIKPAIRLAVPYHRQEHSLSCEIASLLMALKYRGINIAENELIIQLAVSDFGPRQVGNIWGDPNLGFVGSIDGAVPNTGYGVYEQPIYDLALKYRPAKIITNGTLNDLLAELNDNNPIVVWGVSGSGRDISWKTIDGKTINAKFDEHARTLIGYTGKSNNPQLIILLDPIYGEIRMKTKDFLVNWGKLDNRAVVIY
jgi:uncharacterized protein YvpB